MIRANRKMVMATLAATTAIVVSLNLAIADDMPQDGSGSAIEEITPDEAPPETPTGTPEEQELKALMESLSKQELTELFCNVMLRDSLLLPRECASKICKKSSKTKRKKDLKKSYAQIKKCGQFEEAKVVFKNYKDNEVVADEQYRGKTVYITGESLGVAKDMDEQPYIRLKGDKYGLGWLNLYPTIEDLDVEQENALMLSVFKQKLASPNSEQPIQGADLLMNTAMMGKIVQGSKVYATCVGSGVEFLSPTFRDCSVVSF